MPPTGTSTATGTSTGTGTGTTPPRVIVRPPTGGFRIPKLGKP
jgi:hypothetical protein